MVEGYSIQFNIIVGPKQKIEITPNIYLYIVKQLT